MTRILSLTALALIVVFGVVAPSAFGSSFEAGSYPVTLTGHQLGFDRYTTNAGKVECSEVSYTASLNAASSTVELTPTYFQCVAFGFIAAIDVNGCKLRLHTGSIIVTDEYAGTTDIVCPGTNGITFTTSGCTVQFLPQEGLGKLTFLNTTKASPQPDIDVSYDITESLKYMIASGCVAAKPGTFTNGSYVGSTTLQGENGGGAVGISVTG